MNKGIKTILYPVKDMTQAKTLFCKFLGVEPYADQPYYVGFKIADQDIGGGRLVASVKDKDGNIIGLVQN